MQSNQSGGGGEEESGAKAKQMSVEHQQTFTDGKINHQQKGDQLHYIKV